MKTLKQAGVDAKKFEFKTASHASKYKWDDIFNGQINVLCKGEDYDVETDAMIPKIKTAARRRYKTVLCSTRDGEGKKLADMVVVQAFDMGAAQREAEDIKRAEEKAKRAEADEAEETGGETTATAAA